MKATCEFIRKVGFSIAEWIGALRRHVAFLTRQNRHCHKWEAIAIRRVHFKGAACCTVLLSHCGCGCMQISTHDGIWTLEHFIRRAPADTIRSIARCVGVPPDQLTRDLEGVNYWGETTFETVATGKERNSVQCTGINQKQGSVHK